MELRNCPHCDTANPVAICQRDGRPFVLTTGHAEGRGRSFEDGPLNPVPDDFVAPDLCDFCALRRTGELRAAVEAALRQKTCASCHRHYV